MAEPKKDYKSSYPEPFQEPWREEPLDAELMDEIYQQILYRNRLVLEANGEEFAFYSRKITGEKCPCVDPNRETPVPSCRLCYGTMWIGGYDSKGIIKCRIQPAARTRLMEELGIKPDFRPRAWTMADPVVTTRDFLVKQKPPAEIFEVTMFEEPVIRQNYIPNTNQDAFSKLNVTKIIRVTDTKAGPSNYTPEVDYTLQNSRIVWLTANRPPARTTYYVTYGYVLTYTKRYMIADITMSTQRGKPLHQEFSIEELEPTHPIYSFPSVYDLPATSVNRVGPV